MKKILQSDTIATGLAMFAMFFGAGNLVFPLALGLEAGNKNIFVMAGLLISAVGFPFLGLLGMILFNGNYKEFIYRIGKIPGFILLFVTICLIGPFGALPRCITVSYNTIKDYIPFTPLIVFSIVYAFIAFLLSVRESKILTVLGYVLSPLKLLLLGLMIVKGLMFAPSAPEVEITGLELFKKGFATGYQTMDLIAAFFFSAVVIHILTSNLDAESQTDTKKVMGMVIRSSIIGALLLAVVYIGMGFVAAFRAQELVGVADKDILAAIAFKVLGSAGGLFTGIAVSFACLTTVIALAAVTAEFIANDLFVGKISYMYALIAALSISVAVSTLQFEGIKQLLLPILFVSYPALIVLTLLNIAYKLWGFEMVKIPFYFTIVLSFISVYGDTLLAYFGK